MKALITGITGQDGSYLAELLLDKGYDVHGVVRRSSSINTKRIDHIYSNPKLNLHYGDMTDAVSLNALVNNIMPDEVYHLAAQSHVKVSFETPEYTAQTDAVGTLKLLEAIRNTKKNIRMYNACTSEMFGSAAPPQNEHTPFLPVSPYGAAKLYSYWMAKTYRDGYGMFVSNGILFNHESPRRGETFVTRKITQAVARIVTGKQKVLVLGNLNAIRDWGHAKDYVEAMWLMMQHHKPDDFVIATGNAISVRDFVETAFSIAGMKIKFFGKDEGERGYDTDGNLRVVVDRKYWRPLEVNYLCGAADKARGLLLWKPKYSVYDLIDEMVKKDIENENV